METKHPELCKEWSERNYPLLPRDVTPYSNRKVWWKGKCGHEWYGLISSRTEGHGCPYCNGNALLRGYNDFGSKFPEISIEWSEKNYPITPYSIFENSKKMVWWKCSKCRGEYQATVIARKKGMKCPYCTNKKVLVGFNDLEIVNPHVAMQWDYEKNRPLLPRDFTHTSKAFAWWKGTCGHRYKEKICEKVKEGYECKVCKAEFENIFIKLLTMFYARLNELEIRFDDEELLGVALDIFIPELRTVIEIRKTDKMGKEYQKVTEHLCLQKGIKYYKIDNRKDLNSKAVSIAVIFKEADFYIKGDPAIDIKTVWNWFYKQKLRGDDDE